jgi:DNA-binding GntR family transcriptional regulator
MIKKYNLKDSEKAYLRLEEMIVTLKIKPGELISEISIAKLINLGRTPVREALYELSNNGLVNILPRRGIVVTKIDISDQLLVLEVRKVLERLMSNNAAKRSSKEEKKKYIELSKNILLAGNQGNISNFLKIDREFNQLLAVSCRNEYILKTMTRLSPLCRRFFFKYIDFFDLKLTAKLHSNVMKSIFKSDQKSAENNSDKLIDYCYKITLSTLM